MNLLRAALLTLMLVAMGREGLLDRPVDWANIAWGQERLRQLGAQDVYVVDRYEEHGQRVGIYYREGFGLILIVWPTDALD